MRPAPCGYSSACVLRPHFLFSFRKGNGVARQRKRGPRKTGSANRAAIASEEASSIPFPPGRRKLHIRSLLLPFRKPTASLGRLSVDIGKERELSKPGALPAYPSSCRGRRLCRPVGQYDLAEGLRIPDVQRAGRTGASAPTNRIHKIPSVRHHQDRVRRCKIPNGQIVTQ